MKRLKEALDNKGISQRELARRIGITQPAIHFIVKTGSTNMETAIAIANELGYGLDWLCGLDENNSSSYVYDREMGRLKDRLHKLIDEA